MTDPDLFTEERALRRRSVGPLADRMRPQNLDEVVGQDHLLAAGAAFRSMVDAGRLLSMILWGPPGTGKTTLARVVAGVSGALFVQLSAVSAGVKDVRSALATAAQRIEDGRGRTVLFLDEIHRFNKAQQDALLPGVEDGTLILIGATTENPFFEVNAPLVSRCSIFRTVSIEPSDMVVLLERAHTDRVRGLGGSPELTTDALEAIAERVGGDARLALTTLDVTAAIADGRGGAIGVDEVAEALQRRVIRYDKAGDRHYDVISAFIKSVRGSDPDAAMYWLHTMLEAGEDPEFVARRLIILASEDVGLADPDALVVTVAAFDALRVVGLPEAAYALSEATLYLATAPKSNSVATAMQRARDLVEGTATAQVPPHLRSAATAGERSMGHGIDYRYPHDDPAGVLAQQYLPDGSTDAIVYRPRTLGTEAEIAERLVEIDALLGKRPRSEKGNETGS